MTRWTWVWVNPGSWWWTGRPGLLQSMGSRRVGDDWATNWTELRKWEQDSEGWKQSKPRRVSGRRLSQRWAFECYARKAFHEFVQVGGGEKCKAVECCWSAEWERRRGKMWSQRKTQGLSPGRPAVTSLILRITGSPCGWWADPSGSWWGRGHLHSSGSWVSADRHSSGSGVDCASEMLFIWLTAEFICSVTYLISLTKKKKHTLLPCLVWLLFWQFRFLYNLTGCSLSMEKYLPTGVTQMVFLPKPWYMAHVTYVSLRQNNFQTFRLPVRCWNEMSQVFQTLLRQSFKNLWLVDRQLTCLPTPRWSKGPLKSDAKKILAWNICSELILLSFNDNDHADSFIVLQTGSHFFPRISPSAYLSTCAYVLSRVWLSAIPRTAVHRVPLSVGLFQARVGCHFLLQGISPTRG